MNLNKNLLAMALTLAVSGVQASASDGRPSIAPVMRLQAAAETGQYELLIYGDIGESWWGESVTARDVVDQLNSLSNDVTQINVRINSYGGSVADGLAIFNALRRVRASKVVTVDGVAMSSASLIAMAGDEVIMGDASLLMIHAPWGGAVGNAKDLRLFADVLDTFADAMAGAYTTKSGKTRADVLALLTDGADHYYTGAQAVAEGFADRLVTQSAEEPDEQARAQASGLLQRFLTRAPEDMAQLAIAASLRSRISASREAKPPASPANNGEDLMHYLARARQRLQNRATDDNGGGGGSNPAPAPAAAAAAAEAQATAQALAAVRDRNDRIHAALRDVLEVPGVRAIYEEALRDPTMSVESVLQRALGAQASQAQPANGGGPRSEIVADQRDRFIAGVSNAVLARAGIGQVEAGNDFRGIELHNIIRMSLRNAGVSGVDRMERVQLAERVLAMHGSSDFPLIVANTANKALRAAYDAAQPTWRQWCAIGEVSDFKANSRIQLGTFNSLAEIAPGGEYTYGGFGEEAESIRAITKGKGLAMTRQLIINDDLGVFVNAARMLGFAAARTVNEDVYARLAASTAMSDTGALFNATAVTTAGGHANYTSSGTALSVASIIVGEAAMAAQKDKNLRTALNLTPKYLLAPRGKRGIAWELLNSAADPASSNSNKLNFAASLGLELIVDAELDRASATAWYLAADKNVAPLIEVDFLNGEQTPYVAESIDWETDAMKLKVRLDYGVQAIEWRAGYKNAGA